MPQRARCEADIALVPGGIGFLSDHPLKTSMQLPAAPVVNGVNGVNGHSHDVDHPFPGPSRTRESLYVGRSATQALSSQFLSSSPSELCLIHSLPKLALKPWIAAAPESLLLRDCLVVDPAAGRLLEGAHDVLLKGGKIAAVEPAGTLDIAHGAAKEVHLGGKYLCP